MIKIFSFVKDEGDKIQDWLNYHSQIVGIENIFIIDHMSTDGTYEILQKYKGLNLIRSNVPFHKKSEVLSTLMKLHSGFLIPLDADEFLCYKNSNDILCESTLIKNYISRLPIGSFRYKFHQLDVIPKETKVNDPIGNYMLKLFIIVQHLYQLIKEIIKVVLSAKVITTLQI